MPKDETSEFLKEFEPKEEQDILHQPLAPEKEKVEEEEPVEDEGGKRNRRERRLAAKYQAERESSIALAAKLESLTEAQRLQRDTEPSEYLKAIEKIYGTDTPEATAATELLKTALRGVEETSTKRALELFREEQRQAQEEVSKEERTLDSFIEQIEDEFDVSLNATQQKGFFQMMEKMSPKDSEGNITAYADPSAVWELYAEKTQKKDTRAKDLSSRSMTHSGTSKDTTLQSDSTERFLKESGII